MNSKFPAKIRFTTALISSAMLVSGCATDPSSFGALRPIYRAQTNLPGISTQAFYAAGKQYFSEKRYGLALEAFQAELRHNGKSVKALNGIAACYDKLQRYDLAVNYYYQALSVDSESTRTLSNLGYSFLLQRRDTDAKKVLDLALSKEPGNVFIKRNLALATSRIQELANRTTVGLDPKNDEMRQASSVTEQAEAALAIDTKQTQSHDAENTDSHRSEPAASGTIVRVTDSETQVGDAAQNLEDEAVSTITNVAALEIETSTVTVEEKPAEVVDSQPLAVSAVTDEVVDEEAQVGVVDKQVDATLALNVPEVTAVEVETSAAVERLVEVVDSEPLAVSTVTDEVVNEDAQVSATERQVEVASTASIPNVAAVDVETLVAEERIAEVVDSESLTVGAMKAEVVDEQTQAVQEVKAEAESTVAVIDADASSDGEGVSGVLDNMLFAVSTMIAEVTESETQTVKGSASPVIADVAVAEEPVKHVVESQQVDVVLTPTNTELSINENESITVLAADDSGLLPTIDINSQHEESSGSLAIVSPEKNHSETVVSGKEKIDEVVAISDSGLLPTIDIMNEIEVTQLQSREAKETSVQKIASIATIDVDVALAETRVVTADDTKTLSTSGSEKRLGNIQNEESASPVMVNDSFEYTIEVSNGNGWNGMARRLGNHLESAGEQVVRLTNANAFNYANTVIYYTAGKRAMAERLANQFLVNVQLQQTSRNRQDIDVRVVIGKDVIAYTPNVGSALLAWKTDSAAKPVSATVEIANGNGRNGMARLLRGVLVNGGDSILRVTNADNFEHKKTVIYFSKGRHKAAQQLASKLPVQAVLKETSNNRQDIDLKLVIGKDFLGYEVAMRSMLDANA